MNLPAALATGVSIAAYTVVDGIGVRVSGNWIAYTGGMFAFFPRHAAVVSGAAAGAAMFADAAGRSGQGGERRG